jgi:DnaJ homolog subfamily C member 9
VQAYLDGEGSVEFILENVMACSYEDEPRFIDIVNGAVKEGKVETFPRWKKDTSEKANKARRKAAEKEAKEAEELSKELGLDKRADKLDEKELGKLILQRHQSRMASLLDKLESEAQTGAKRGKRKEPTEQEFQEARARVEARQNKKRK